MRKARFEVLLLTAMSLAVGSSAFGLTLPPISSGFVVDFGGVIVGGSNVQTVIVPLVVHFSDLPPDFVVYAGGNAVLDEAIALNNALGGVQITVPITASELITLFGDVGVSYTVSALTLDHGVNFLLDPGDCINASGATCTGSLTFAPQSVSGGGFLTDVLRGQVGSLVFSGGNGQLASLLDLLAPTIVSVLDGFFVVNLEGTPFAGLPPAPAALALYSSVQPCRIIDTRLGGGPLIANTSRAFNVVGSTSDFVAQGGHAGGCALPGFLAVPLRPALPRVQAVAINLVAVGPAGPGDLRAFATGTPMPLASVINFAAVPGLNVANGIVVPVRQDQEGSDITLQADVSSTHVVADVVGYFSGLDASLQVPTTCHANQTLFWNGGWWACHD